MKNKISFKNILTTEYTAALKKEDGVSRIYEETGKNWDDYFMARLPNERILDAESRMKVFSVTEENVSFDSVYNFIGKQENSSSKIIYPNIWGLQILCYSHHIWRKEIWKLLSYTSKRLLGFDHKSNLHNETYGSCVPFLSIRDNGQESYCKYENIHGARVWNDNLFSKDDLFFFFELK